MSGAREIERVFLFADLSGYTALTEAHGNVEAGKVLTRYVEMTAEVLAPEARLVERVGDELLVVSEDVPGAVSTAVNLRDAIEHEPFSLMVRAPACHVGTVLSNMCYGMISPPGAGAPPFGGVFALTSYSRNP